MRIFLDILKALWQCDEECGERDILEVVSDKIPPTMSGSSRDPSDFPFPKILKSIQDTFKSLQNFTKLSFDTVIKNPQLRGSKMS